MPMSISSKIFQKMFDWVLTIFIILKQINAMRALAKSGGFCYTVSSLLGCGNAREGEKNGTDQ